MTYTHYVKEFENRDTTTTTITLSNGDRVDVNPIDLFQNMLENASLEDALDILNDISEVLV